jgi:SOS-response transcriptional repressor LexA
MILDWIADFASVHGCSPSVREIGRAFGIRSTNCVVKHLRALERKGHIKRHRGVVRGLVVVGTGTERSR